MLKVYSQSLDKILRAVAYAKLGKPQKAAKHLADAMQQDDFDATVDALDAQQEQLYDPVGDDFGVDDLDFQQQDQQQFSKALSRIQANTQKVLAADDSDNDASSSEDSAEEAGAGEFEGVDEGGDARDVTIEHASADSASDSSSGEQQEAKVLSSAKQRLARQERAAANKAAMAKKRKTK